MKVYLHLAIEPSSRQLLECGDTEVVRMQYCVAFPSVPRVGDTIRSSYTDFPGRYKVSEVEFVFDGEEDSYITVFIQGPLNSPASFISGDGFVSWPDAIEKLKAAGWEWR